MDNKINNSASVISVIEVKSPYGNGTQENPNRWIIQYWSLEGELLAENDPYISKKE